MTEMTDGKKYYKISIVVGLSLFLIITVLFGVAVTLLTKEKDEMIDYDKIFNSYKSVECVETSNLNSYITYNTNHYEEDIYGNGYYKTVKAIF